MTVRQGTELLTLRKNLKTTCLLPGMRRGTSKSRWGTSILAVSLEGGTHHSEWKLIALGHLYWYSTQNDVSKLSVVCLAQTGHCKKSAMLAVAVAVRGTGEC